MYEQQQQQDTSFPRYECNQTALYKAFFNPNKPVHLPLSHQQSCIFPSSSIVSIIPCIWCINIDLAEASSSPLAIFHQASSIKHRPSAIVHQASSIRHRLSRYEHTHHHPSKPVCIGLSQLTLTASLALAIVIITHRSSSVVHRPSPIVHVPSSVFHRASSIVYHRPQHQYQYRGFEHEPTSISHVNTSRHLEAYHHRSCSLLRRFECSQIKVGNVGDDDKTLRLFLTVFGRGDEVIALSELMLFTCQLC
jgi:hypothetical protein